MKGVLEYAGPPKCAGSGRTPAVVRWVRELGLLGRCPECGRWLKTYPSGLTRWHKVGVVRGLISS